MIHEGRVALVAGASRGIGAAVAAELAHQGARVALLGRSTSDLERVAQGIEGDGGTALVVPADASELSDVEAAIDRVREHWGPVEILVNNAAVGEPLGPVWEADPARFVRAVAVNLTGAWYVLRTCVPGMLAGGYGRIVAVSSNAAVGTFPTLGPYCATKAAFDRLHHVAAAELSGTPVHLNVVWPGGVDTELQGLLRDDRFAFAELAREVHDSGRLRSPRDVAPTIVALCGDDEQRHGQLIDIGDRGVAT